MAIKRILLVDDDTVANYLTRRTLEDCRIDSEIDIALDGQHAIDLIEARGTCPDVIFLDINMPVIDGFEFLKMLEDRPCYGHARVYMLSSSIRDADKEMALKFLCVKDYLEKPLTAEVINEVIDF